MEENREIDKSAVTIVSHEPLLVSLVVLSTIHRARAFCNANDRKPAFSRHLEICQGVRVVYRRASARIFNSIACLTRDTPNGSPIFLVSLTLSIDSIERLQRDYRRRSSTRTVFDHALIE